MVVLGLVPPGGAFHGPGVGVPLRHRTIIVQTPLLAQVVTWHQTIVGRSHGTGNNGPAQRAAGIVVLAHTARTTIMWAHTAVWASAPAGPDDAPMLAGVVQTRMVMRWWTVPPHRTPLRDDAFDDLVAEQTDGQAVTSTVNAAGERTGLHYPSGLALTLTRDAVGQVTALGEATLGTLATWTYAGIERPATMAVGNGATGAWAYDGLARLAESTWTTAAGELLVGHQLHYNKASQILADLAPQLPNDTGQRYQYDSRWRLTQASQGVPEALTQLGAVEPAQFTSHTTYGWDAVDNFTTVVQKTAPSDPASDQHQTYTTNALHQYLTRTTTMNEAPVGTEAFTADANGNRTQDGTHRYTYTWRNQLQDVRDGSGTVVVAYTYDAVGRRIARQDGATGAETRYVYDGGHVLEERTTEDAVAAAYVYGDGFGGGPGTPLAMVRDDLPYFYHVDHRDSVEAITDAQGMVVERTTYDPFGQVTITDAAGNPRPTSVIGNPYLFTAKRRDPVTHLYDSRARDYDPNMGRFLQRDPLGYVDGLNTYAYAMSNPVNFLDPWGLSTVAGQGNAGAGNPPPPGLIVAGKLFGETLTMSGGMVVGAGSAVVDMVGGLVRSVAHPWQTTVAIASAHLHPWHTALAVRDAATAWATQLATASSYEQGQLLGHAGTDLAALFLSAGTGTALKGATTAEQLGVVGEIGRAARGAASAERLVIGRGADLAKPGALRLGEFRLSWKATETTKSEWKINSGLLRTEMNKGLPIRDISPRNTGGMYLNAERNLLQNRGWTFDPATNYWLPPGY